MQRRQFLKTGGTAALALSAVGRFGEAFADARPRVGLIGSGWYGKSDLLRLLQVAPVEVVSLCDVDSAMLAGAADLVASRQQSKKRPRTYADYREMLTEKDLDIVLIATPGPLARAADDRGRARRAPTSTSQKPISVDVVEGQAMLAAARKHGRVVQVGTQRRSTPHLVEARDRHHARGQARQDRPGRDLLLLPHARATRIRPTPPPPAHLDYEMWTGPAPMRPYNPLVHPRGWRAFMEYGNGIVGDMCIHMLDMVRWMLDLGWPRRDQHRGGILVDKGSKVEHHRHADRDVRLRRPAGGLDSTAPGARRPTRSTRGARRSTATRAR